MDLDNFKQVNDAYGHLAGDELLRTTAKKLASCVDNGEHVARMGGDEFAMIIPCTGVACAEQKMQRIYGAFRQDIFFEGTVHQQRISVGYGVFSQIGDLTKLTREADEAMYRNKRGT